MFNEVDFSKERERMVSSQLEARGIKDDKVLAAFRKVQRHRFVLNQNRGEAYGDHPVSIGCAQTISQPYMVAFMTELLKLKGTEKVLEIGTGSGYQTAILAEMAKEVYSVERIASLSENAKKVLAQLRYKNIHLDVSDGSLGWEAMAPFDAIIVTCGSPSVPEPLKRQLVFGGRLLIPVGGDSSQTLTVVERRDKGFEEKGVCGCVFVPLVGEHGWRR